MATLTPYFANGSTPGSNWDLLRHVGFFWPDIGDAIFVELTPFKCHMSGIVEVLGKRLPLEVQVHLRDENNAAAAGPCRAVLNGTTDDQARYKVVNDTLTVQTTADGKPQEIAIKRVENGSQTELALSGAFSHTLHLRKK